jgi:nickel/cobalt exporter
MFNLITGSLLISLLHAVIPNHWLPVVALGRKEGWGIGEVTRITVISGLAHVISTVMIGVLLGMLGVELAIQVEKFTRVIAPLILIAMGVFFIRRHYTHHHFHVESKEIAKRPKQGMITALVIAMFFSPCLEIEGYFLLAGSRSWNAVLLVGTMYTVITITGMILWVRIAYKGLVKLNWHKWEHNAGIITGIVLIITGICSFFIH